MFPPNVKLGDIVRGLPVADRTASGVYCSHVLEHLARDDLPVALQNTYKILMPGASFRLVVPDLHWRVSQYLLAAGSEQPLAPPPPRQPASPAASSTSRSRRSSATRRPRQFAKVSASACGPDQRTPWNGSAGRRGPSPTSQYPPSSAGPRTSAAPRSSRENASSTTVKERWGTSEPINTTLGPGQSVLITLDGNGVQLGNRGGNLILHDNHNAQVDVVTYTAEDASPDDRYVRFRR